MKNTDHEMCPPVASGGWHGFAGGVIITAAAWGATCGVTYAIASYGGGGNVQAAASLVLLVALPLAVAVCFALYAARARGARRRSLATAGLGLVVGVVLLTGLMLSSANRRSRICQLFAAHEPAADERAK